MYILSVEREAGITINFFNTSIVPPDGSISAVTPSKLMTANRPRAEKTAASAVILPTSLHVEVQT